jgi:glycerol-3-phosphate O-acyltransferase / dihydroxyacetone phosphate acyltransferase
MYRAIRSLIGLALGFYFRRIERFHAERVPASGPVLFTSNHPNSVTDSFVIGASVHRKVNFVATVQLFRVKPVKWLLTRCGVIPINRVKDDPKAMRTITDTFEACYRVLEAGEAIGIFPEGITYEDDQLKEIKSGAARMALELESRHKGNLGLQIVPVGLTFSAKEIYRSDVLVHFGEPIRPAEFLKDFDQRRKECIRNLTAEIECRLQTLILHIPQLEHARLIGAVKRLYLDRLMVGNRVVQEALSHRAEELLLTQQIVAAVEQVYRDQPARAAAFSQKLDLYERWIKRLQISEEQLAHFPQKGALAFRSVSWTLMAILGAPVALYGWLHRLIPFAVVRWAIGRFSEPGKRKSQTSSAAIAAGVISFTVFYGACILGFYQFFGWPATLYYGLSLPIASLLAHYYVRELCKFGASIRNTIVFLRSPGAVRRLQAMRAQLITEIDSVRTDLKVPGNFNTQSAVITRV